jgi:hypothetical protein
MEWSMLKRKGNVGNKGVWKGISFLERYRTCWKGMGLLEKKELVGKADIERKDRLERKRDI